MRHKLWITFALLAFSYIGSNSAHSQEMSNNFEVRDGEYPALWSGWFDYDSFMPTLAKLIADHEERVGGPCTGRFTIDADINRPARDQFAQNLRKSVDVDSVWSLKVFVEKCGRSTFSGLVFNSKDDTLVQIALFGPGKTISSSQLQKDVAVAIYASLRSVIADRENCPALKDQPMIFYDREVTDSPKLSDPQPSWTERWAVPLCGKIIIFKIDNQINDRGAAYSIRENGILEPRLFTVSDK